MKKEGKWQGLWNSCQDTVAKGRKSRKDNYAEGCRDPEEKEIQGKGKTSFQMILQVTI